MSIACQPTRALTDALDVLAGADPALLADGETIEALHRQLERLEAVTTRASAAFEAEGSWEADGARSAAAWLAGRCTLPLPAARRRIHLGRALRNLPVVEAAWLTGEVGEAHVSLLAAARTPATAGSMERDQALLVDHARDLSHRHFVRALAYWQQRADPDGNEDDARAHHAARRLHVSQSFEGRWFLDGVLDPIGGDIVTRALQRIDDELFEADWAEARARLGDEACAGDLARTPAQRRSDALVEMARRAGAVPSGARLPRPLFSVLVGYETFAGRICELARGTVVTPGALQSWLAEADVERVVFDGPDRVIGVGPRRRLFTGATRRAVAVRDRECFSEFCDVTAEDCEIDHIEPYAAGGLTVEQNGRAACGYHNRRRHRRR